MSFDFSAIGTRDQVLGQLRSHHAIGDDELAAAARQLVTDALRKDGPLPGRTWTHGAWDHVYLVKADGHAGPGSPTRLTLTIDGYFVPVIEPEVIEIPVGEPTAAQLAEEDRARFEATPQQFKDGLQEIDQHVRTRDEVLGR